MWKEITNQREQPTDLWNWREDQGGEIEGEFLGTTQVPSKYRGQQNLHSIKTQDGQIWNFFGSTVLDRKLEQIEQGRKIKIHSLGKVDGEKSQYYDFQVFIWDE